MKRTGLLKKFVLLLCLCGISSLAFADQDQPYEIVNTAQLKALLDSNQTLALFDARTPGEYQQVHIPSAINLPAKQFAKFAHLLPQDKTTPVLFYCNGVKCGKSRLAAEEAIILGYSKVIVYAQGMPVWEEAGMPLVTGPNYAKKIETEKVAPQKLQLLLQTNITNITLVDVRDADEFTQGHIPGAINIPVENFSQGSGLLDKKKTIIVYCNSGNRSYQAYRKLISLGYKHHKQALFADWKTAGLPVKTESTM